MFDYGRHFYEDFMDDAFEWGLELPPWEELSDEAQRGWNETAAEQARKETQDAQEQ